MTFGVAPGLVADALRPGVALRVTPIRGRWMFPVDLSVDAPGRLDDAARGARVQALPVRLGVGACGRSDARVTLFACGTLSAGAVLAWGDGYAPDRTAAAFAASVGARAGLELPLSPRWRFVASIDVQALLVRPAVAVGGDAGGVLWTAPPVAASIAAGVAWQNR
jgi:hypothetical protein